MMCERPFVRTQNGLRRVHAAHTEALQAATPFGCGRCLPCRINKGRVWQNRLMLEHSVHECSAFVTLTYNDEWLPEGGNLVPEDMSGYIKRLRKRLHPVSIRFFGCGEYGPTSYRPHYHIACFNIDGLRDESAIRDAWQDRGFVDVGELNEASIKYMTGYIMKGWTFDGAKKLNGRHKEFMRCSRRPGIGSEAIFKMAARLKKKSFYRGQRVKELRRGKASWPLGRLLQGKMDEALGVDPAEIYQELLDYQTELFEKHVEGKEAYYTSLVNEKKLERRAQKWRHKNFKAKRSI